jgi:hypothetical protein
VKVIVPAASLTVTSATVSDGVPSLSRIVAVPSTLPGTLTDPEVRVEGNTAWVTYVNRGSVQDAAGVTERSWLESAVLGKEEGVWRIHFFHSTRVQPD